MSTPTFHWVTILLVRRLMSSKQMTLLCCCFVLFLQHHRLLNVVLRGDIFMFVFCFLFHNIALKESVSKLIFWHYRSFLHCGFMNYFIIHETLCNDSIACVRYKGKSYRAMVQICKTSDQIDQFCRRVCLRLECCPNLVSSQNVNGRCPERCFALTKTKYSESLHSFFIPSLGIVLSITIWQLSTRM